MSPEKHSSGKSQAVKDVLRGQAKDLLSPESGLRLNRQQKRLLGRLEKKVGRIGLPLVVPLIPEEQILEQEDDISFLRRELKLYQSAQSYTSMEIDLYTQLRQLGITDATCKKVLLERDIDNLLREVIGELETKDPRRIAKITTVATNMLSPRHKRFYDSDEADLVDGLIEDGSISGKDILTEVMRARRQSIGLMRMQIDWLKEREILAAKKQRADKKTAEEQLSPAVLQNVPEESPEASTDLETGLKQEVEEQFLLEGWRLFITDSPWSSKPNHLTSIPTNSRQDTLGAVATLTRGGASIKPNSVLSALEFHLRKDVIQQALATRLRYGPDGIRDWVKIKRGKDRIFFLIPDLGENRAIFFVEGRDKVYESI